MIINCSPEFKKLGKIANRLVSANGKADNLLRDATLQIGRASDPKYGVPASAVNSPIYVGDHAVLGSVIGNSAEIEALYKKNPLAVNMKPRFNIRTGKYDVVCSKSGIQSFVGDSGELVTMQSISPWNASYFPELKKQLNFLTQRVDTIINALQNAPTAVQDGGAAYKAGIAAILATIVNKENFSNIESDKVKHGKGGN